MGMNTLILSNSQIAKFLIYLLGSEKKKAVLVFTGANTVPTQNSVKLKSMRVSFTFSAVDHL